MIKYCTSIQFYLKKKKKDILVASCQLIIIGRVARCCVTIAERCGIITRANKKPPGYVNIKQMLLIIEVHFLGVGGRFLLITTTYKSFFLSATSFDMDEKQIPAQVSSNVSLQQEQLVFRNVLHVKSFSACSKCFKLCVLHNFGDVEKLFF